MVELWGKDWDLPGKYSLLHHALDTAAAAAVLWEMHVAEGTRQWLAVQLEMSPDEACRFVTFVAGLHDVGKAVSCFQTRVPGPGANGYVRHDQAGYLTVPVLLGGLAKPSDPFTGSVAHRIGEIIGGHHGVFQQVDRRLVRDPVQDARLGGERWQARRQELVAALTRLLDPVLPEALPLPVAAVLTGLVIVADWVASDTEWISKSQWGAPVELPARWDHTVAALRERVDRLGLVAPKLRATVRTADLLSEGSAPNALQRSVDGEFKPSGAGVLVLAAPTGIGKTESGFVAAGRIGAACGRPGITMCLPTRATTNAMWARGQVLVERMSRSANRVTMGHSMAALHGPYRDYCADDAAYEWLNGRHRPLLAGLSVVTVDQVLVAALAVKHNMVRLWALTGKTVIVDEVHALAPYMLTLLARVLSWCGFLSVPVVLMSATLPGHVAQELVTAYLRGARPDRDPHVRAGDYPGWAWYGIDGSVQHSSAVTTSEIRQELGRTARIEHLRYQVGDRITVMVERIHRVIDSIGCVAVVCSTVESAQYTCQALRNRLPDGIPVRLLHARFPGWQRDDIETDLMNSFGRAATRANGRRPAREVVVSTALIEQSLDLDFDLVISDLAPMALLIQRLGRCWRHDRPVNDRPGSLSCPTLVVLDPEVEQLPAAWTAVHDEYELLVTRQVLAERGPDLRIPDDVDGLVQRVHHRDLPPWETAAADAWLARHATADEHRMLAHWAATPLPRYLDHLERITYRIPAAGHETDAGVDPELALTRLGVDAARVIPRFVDDAGDAWLDADHTWRFPHTRLTEEQLRHVILASVPCPTAWVAGLDAPPQRWRHPLLRNARILPMPGAGGLRLEPELGLLRGTPHDVL